MASHLSNTYARGSLPSKRFQSSYAGAKIRVEKQKTTKKKKCKNTKKKKFLFLAFVLTYTEMLASQAMPG